MKVIEHTWIPMSDGVRLSAKIWIPDGAAHTPVPAILEYIPYRKRDFKAVRDEETYTFYAQHGYAGVRVDLRGSGESEGILQDEYLQQELDDGLEILSWIAAQDWCNGNVGIIGISWGGFNGLQLAALQPPELKAVVSVASSDDRYQDDVHYMGGNLLTDNLSWASTMFAYNSCPPDPELVGEKWFDMWMERLEGSGLWLKKWLEHQRYDDYWRHASVMFNYDKIKAPVYVVSGWADGYSNTIFRLLENLKVPTKGLVGPWGHKYPHHGSPGPKIDFLDETRRWWDRWLKDEQNGIDKEPRLRVWMQDTVSPISSSRPGRWVGEKDYTTPNIHMQKYHLKPATLDKSDKIDDFIPEMTIQSPLSVGLFAGKWLSYSATTDLPSDQREEDGGALIFDTLPLEDDLEILGAPQVELALSSDKPVGMVAVRLSDVAPNGRATRVTYGVLNLTHRDSDENPTELEPGKKYKVKVDMNYIAQRFPKGHQLRLAISTSYWPLTWPSPEPVRLTIYPGESLFSVPERVKGLDQNDLRDLDTHESTGGMNTTTIIPAHREWKVEHDMANNEVSLNVVNNDAKYRLDDINWTIQKKVQERYSYKNNNYDTVRGEVKSERTFERDDWFAKTITRTVLTSTRTHFIIRATLDTYHGDVRVFSKSWDEQIKRDLL
ncbi:Cocaine esterase [Salinivirga cyanobacteriivorans]|uniref:Cocaine esterase n=1 Tax=Salinivirga cyanobacteriivorans TaxID=1307839 RepID=A0A0S2HZH8_9BACT|nr:CocE/NonD family hydrolase [Salinivirga cyanobacteriivorans]ALO15464.1 Cocaine esterase [Salinivirga cyanobacteriivorans]